MSPKSRTRIYFIYLFFFFFPSRNLSQSASWLPGVKVLSPPSLLTCPFLWLSVQGKQGWADVGWEEAVCLLPRVCSRRWDPGAKAFIPLLVLCMGILGSFWDWFVFCVFFKPGQTSICYSKLSIQHRCCCYFFIEHFGSATEGHTLSKSFPCPPSLIIFYKVWLGVSYPLTAPAPNIAQTARKTPEQPCHARVVTSTV